MFARTTPHIIGSSRKFRQRLRVSQPTTAGAEIQLKQSSCCTLWRKHYSIGYVLVEPDAGNRCLFFLPSSGSYNEQENTAIKLPSLPPSASTSGFEVSHSRSWFQGNMPQTTGILCLHRTSLADEPRWNRLDNLT